MPQKSGAQIASTQPPESPSSASLAATEALVDGQLLTCRALAQAVGSAISALSEAGQGLQRGVCDVVVDGVELNARLAKEDVAVSLAGRDLVGACKVFGVTLISLAAVLSGEVLSPLEEMHRSFQAERKQRQSDLARFREQEINCSNALTDSLLKKDKALADLQKALKEQRESPTKQRNKMSLFGSKVDVAASAVETKVQRAASSQTVAIEELAERTDEAMLARMHADDGAKALKDTLARVDKARKRSLHTALDKCATAFAEAANVVHSEAQKLQATASELQKSILNDCSRTSHEFPRTGSGALDAVEETSAPSRMSSAESDLGKPQSCDNREETDSPFAAPSATLGARWSSSSQQSKSSSAPALSAQHSFCASSSSRHCISGATGLQELRAKAVSGNPFRDSDLEDEDDVEEARSEPAYHIMTDHDGRVVGSSFRKSKRRPAELTQIHAERPRYCSEP